jgi:Glycosyltransferases involved in cell wall biogenesis
MKNANPLVSILLPIYKVEKYIEKCLDTVINQTYKNLEIVLVDDGTPDNAGKIADEYARKDKRIKVIHQANGGLSEARNTGLNNATGEYIIFGDSDDYFALDFVEYMLSIVEKTGADIAITTNTFTTRDFKQIKNDSIETWTNEKAVTEFLYPALRIGAWNKMYKRELIEKNNLRFVKELTTGEGMQFITNIAQYANCIGVGHRKVYYYRLNNVGSATTKPNVERQGKGSLATLKYIESHLSMQTDNIKMALRWHYWSCYFYTLRNIVEAKEQKKYKELYNECKNKLRTEAIPLLKAKISLKMKMKMLLLAISPVIGTKFVILTRRIRIKFDRVE